MGSKPKAPKPIDVAESTQQINTQNTQNAQQQAAYNRPNQSNQFGSQLQWRQTGTDANGNPTFEQSQTLGGEGQQFASGFSGLGQQYINQAGNFVGNRPDMGSSAAFDRAYEFASGNLEPRFQRASEQLDTKLKNQGLDPTSEAYKSASNDLALQQNEARNNLVTGIQGQLFNQGLADRQQQGSELSLLQPGVNYGNQAINSGFANVPGVNIQNTDVAGLINQRQNQLNQNYQNDLNSYNGMLGGIAGLGGTIAGSFFGMPQLGGAIGGALGGAAKKPSGSLF